jgi:hypothetical protein
LAYWKLAEKLRENDLAANNESAVKKINKLRSSFRKEMKKLSTLRRRRGRRIQAPFMVLRFVVIFNRSGKYMR